MSTKHLLSCDAGGEMEGDTPCARASEPTRWLVVFAARTSQTKSDQL